MQLSNRLSRISGEFQVLVNPYGIRGKTKWGNFCKTIPFPLTFFHILTIISTSKNVVNRIINEPPKNYQQNSTIRQYAATILPSHRQDTVCDISTTLVDCVNPFPVQQLRKLRSTRMSDRVRKFNRSKRYFPWCELFNSWLWRRVLSVNWINNIKKWSLC